MSYSNELQAAYYNSCAFADYGSLDIPAGCFAVVACSRIHCSITDAMLPSPYRKVERLSISRALADYVAKKENAKLAAYEHYEGEYWYEVFPKAPAPVMPPAPSYYDDEIPF